MILLLLTHLAGPAHACTWPSTGVSSALWPSRHVSVEVPPDPVFWASQDAPEPSLVHEGTGEPVPVEVVAHPGGTWSVIPSESLVEGATYLLADELGAWATLTVGDPADVPAPPTPVRRALQSERFYEGYTACGTEVPDRFESGVSYTLCNEGVLLVYAVGVEPAEPTVTDLRGAIPASFPDRLSLDVDDRWDGDGAGASVTVWFGAFGPDGAFSGWSADEVVLPEETDAYREDRKPGVEASTTPTFWLECPQGDWILGEVVVPVPAVDDPPQKGCATTGGAGGGLGLLALLLIRRRR